MTNPTSKKLTRQVLEGMRLRHAAVEKATDKLSVARDMAYLSHLDRAELLAKVERLSSALRRIEKQEAPHGTMTVREASNVARDALSSDSSAPETKASQVTPVEVERLIEWHRMAAGVTEQTDDLVGARMHRERLRVWEAHRQGSPEETSAHQHSDECWELNSGCDMGRSDAHAVKASVDCSGCRNGFPIDPHSGFHRRIIDGGNCGLEACTAQNAPTEPTAFQDFVDSLPENGKGD